VTPTQVRDGARADKKMTDADLDAACEAHLAAKFGEKLDFALENALPTLLQDGLVKREGVRRRAAPRRALPCALGYSRVFSPGDTGEACLVARWNQGSRPAWHAAVAWPRASSESCAAGARRACASARASCDCRPVMQGGLAAVPLEDAHAALLRKWRATDGGDLPACMPHGPRNKPARPRLVPMLAYLSPVSDASATYAVPDNYL